MKPEEVQNLLGGYAAGTLTPAERKLLFDAAMEDQALFDALADEQAFKELLDDPESRGYLRAALDEVTEPPLARKARWPKAAAISTFAAALTLVTVVGIRQTQNQGVDTKTVEVAQSTPARPSPAPSPMSAAAPPPQPVLPQASPRKESARNAAEVSGIARELEAPAAKPVPATEPAPASLPPEEKAAATVRSETNENTKLAQNTPPATAPATRARTSLDARRSASELFLVQYRQNFLANTSNAGGSVQTFGALRDSSAQRKPSPAQSRQQAATEGERASQRAPGSAPESVAAVNRGIRYQILRRNSAGGMVQTRLDTRFEAGDVIQLQIEKNAQGFVSVFLGSAPVAIANQNDRSALTAPLPLSAGSFDLSIVFAETPSGPQLPLASQLTEESGNLMYVVLPGPLPNPVVATFRITVHQR